MFYLCNFVLGSVYLCNTWDTQQEFDEAEQCSEQHLPVFQQFGKLVNERTGHGLEHSKLEDRRSQCHNTCNDTYSKKEAKFLQKNSGKSA